MKKVREYVYLLTRAVITFHKTNQTMIEIALNNLSFSPVEKMEIKTFCLSILLTLVVFLCSFFAGKYSITPLFKFKFISGSAL